MSEQLKDKCPICGAYLFSDDDIVHCPECGAPHHRDCWNTIGHCGLADAHGTDKQYKKADSQEQQKPKNVCKDCGRELPEDSNFCPFCGWNTDSSRANEDDYINFGTSMGAIKIDPYGGVDKNSDIDGVKVRDMARFIAFTPNRIIPKFKNIIETGKKFSWNWVAFLTPYCHALFRKMYSSFFVYLILEITSYVLMTPFYNLFINSDIPINANYAQMAEYISVNMDKFNDPISIILATLGMVLFFGIRIYAGMYNEYLYKNHTVLTIKKIRANPELDDENEFRLRGGVRPFLSMTLFIISTYFGSYIPALLNSLLF